MSDIFLKRTLEFKNKFEVILPRKITNTCELQNLYKKNSQKSYVQL